MRAAPACDRIRGDHREIETQFRLLRELDPDNVSGFRAAVSTVLRLSAAHLAREEQVLFPALRPKYQDLLAHLEEQHGRLREIEGEIAELLADATAHPATEWFEDLRALTADYEELIRHHIVDEDEQLLRIAAASIREEEQAEMAARMDALDGG